MQPFYIQHWLWNFLWCCNTMNTLFYDRLLWIGKLLDRWVCLFLFYRRVLGVPLRIIWFAICIFHIVPQMGISGVLGRISSNLGNFERKTDPVIPPTHGTRISIQLNKHQKIVTLNES